jgi:hypothetical protein
LKSYLDVEEAARVLHLSPWSLRAKAREGLVPHRRPPGTRRLLFVEAELERWIDGAALEIVDNGGGRVVRPRRET